MRTAIASVFSLAVLALAACTATKQPNAPVTPPGSHTTDIDTTGPSGLGSPSGFNSTPGASSDGNDSGGGSAASGRDDVAPIEPGLAQPQTQKKINPRKRRTQPNAGHTP